MTSAYMANPGLKLRVTNIVAQKIARFSLVTYSMVIAAFQVVDKLNCSQIFQKIFLLADISMELILGMPFLILSSIDV